MAVASRNYQDLIAWRKAMDYVVQVYHTVRRFPKEEIYGLTSRIKRAAISIPSNISEGQGRGSDKEFVRFLHTAYGSLRETETQLLIAERLCFLDAAGVQPLLQTAAEVGRLLNGLIKSKER